MIKRIIGFMAIVVFLAFASLQAWAGRTYFPSVQDGNVVALQNGTAFGIIRDAIKGGYGTQIMMKGDLAMFMKSIPNGWGFVVIDTKACAQVSDLKEIIPGGNFTNPKTMADLISFLRDKGWVAVASSKLSPSFLSAANATGRWLGSMAGSLFTLTLVPANTANNPVLVPVSKQE